MVRFIWVHALNWLQAMVGRVIDDDDSVIDVMRARRVRAFMALTCFTGSSSNVCEARDPHENSFSQFFTIRMHSHVFEEARESTLTQQLFFQF